jgi:hypothetical protein
MLAATISSRFSIRRWRFGTNTGCTSASAGHRRSPCDAWLRPPHREPHGDRPRIPSRPPLARHWSRFRPSPCRSRIPYASGTFQSSAPDPRSLRRGVVRSMPSWRIAAITNGTLIVDQAGRSAKSELPSTTCDFDPAPAARKTRPTVACSPVCSWAKSAPRPPPGDVGAVADGCTGPGAGATLTARIVAAVTISAPPSAAIHQQTRDRGDADAPALAC